MDETSESLFGAETRQSPADRSPSPVRRVAVAIGLTVLGVVLSGVLAVPGLLLFDGITAFVVTVALAELGYAVAAWLFLRRTGQGADYVRLVLPASKRTLGLFVVGGAVALFAFRSLVIGAASLAGVPLAPPSLLDSAIDPQAVLLSLIPLSLFVVAPCEELLFRGVIQTYLEGAFSTRGAILGAGILFGLVHLPTYFALPSALGIAVTLGVVFVVGLGFGYLYERTNSLQVAILVHGLYNSLIMASAYVLFTLDVVSV